ncbi:MAG: phosphonate ABC transporter, permease protein PhnE [Pseudomonadota bacterium]
MRGPVHDSRDRSRTHRRFDRAGRPSPERFGDSGPRIIRLLERAWPPSVEPGFLLRTFWKLMETLQIALAGTVIGVILSLPLAWLSAKGISPLGMFRAIPRIFVSFLRTVPDLVWALVFVVAVGLGPVAGTMTIIVDTMGFCGRFFAEAIEDAEKPPQQALEAIGARKLDIMFAAVLPATMPSLINSSLFALEKAVRSSVVLGLVGAGGIGQELAAAFELFQYNRAATIIIAIFAIVLAMELLTDALRKRVS